MLKVHPRGFYGSDHVVVMYNVKPPKNFISKPLEMQMVEEFVANKHIDTIYNQYLAGNIDTSNFDTVAKILATIVKAFGYTDFQLWHAKQYQSPYFGQMHVDYIEDWAKYVLTGSRVLSNYTWGAMLDRSNDPVCDCDRLGQYTATLLGKTTLRPFNDHDSISIVKILSKMLEYPDGLDTIILTAYILFCIKR